MSETQPNPGTVGKRCPICHAIYECEEAVCYDEALDDGADENDCPHCGGTLFSPVRRLFGPRMVEC